VHGVYASYLIIDVIVGTLANLWVMVL